MGGICFGRNRWTVCGLRVRSARKDPCIMAVADALPRGLTDEPSAVWYCGKSHPTRGFSAVPVVSQTPSERNLFTARTVLRAQASHVPV